MKTPISFFVLSLLLSLAPALHAQTMLLVSKELRDGAPLPPPLAVREGLSSALFEEGFVVFDDNSGTVTADGSALMSLARSTGAEMILQVSTEYAETDAGAAVATISTRTSFTLTSVGKAAVVTRGSLDATNKGRERTVDRAALGMEIGRAITARIRAVLAGSAS